MAPLILGNTSTLKLGDFIVKGAPDNRQAAFLESNCTTPEGWISKVYRLSPHPATETSRRNAHRGTVTIRAGVPACENACPRESAGCILPVTSSKMPASSSSEEGLWPRQQARCNRASPFEPGNS